MLYKHICPCILYFGYIQIIIICLEISQRGLDIRCRDMSDTARVLSADDKRRNGCCQSASHHLPLVKSNEDRWSCLFFSLHHFRVLLQADFTPSISFTLNLIFIPGIPSHPLNSVWSSVGLSTSPSTPLPCLLFLLASRKLLASREHMT